jgi:hypothetical protein
MASKQRIYIIEGQPGERERLVRATSVAQARNHVARDLFRIKVASQDQLVEFLSAGGAHRYRVEDAARDQAEQTDEREPAAAE